MSLQALRAGAEVAVSEGSMAATKVLTWQLASGVTRTTVGITGIINNAGARETKLGEYANHGRHAYFLATAVTGLTPGSLRTLARSTVLGSDGAAMLGAGGVLNALDATGKIRAANQLIEKINTVPSLGITLMAGNDMVDYIRARRSMQIQHAQRTVEFSTMLNRR